MSLHEETNKLSIILKLYTVLKIAALSLKLIILGNLFVCTSKYIVLAYLIMRSNLKYNHSILYT